MGNREDLLAGARKAILERGLAKVTARDIAGAAGVSLAAIGYHFGTKDRLITEAVNEAAGTELGDGMDAAIRDAGEGRALAESLESTWDGMLDVIQNHREQLLLSFENGFRLMREPHEYENYMGEAIDRVYAGLADVLRQTHPDLAAAEARSLAKVYFALFQGLAVQWMLAPAADTATGADVARAARAMGRE
ncbi:MAG: TetR/AcrR family transcriptional regulator [Nocardia sp.]|nr:TetR/AcrR family transcriptional regulator [Nocardia sp.]